MSSYFGDECPVPIARESRLQRDWGQLHLAWHGSPHRLWMGAESDDGEDLQILGEDIKQVETEFLGERRTAVKRFGGQGYVDGEVAEEFLLLIQDNDKNDLDRIVLTYDTMKCVCAEYDAL